MAGGVGECQGQGAVGQLMVIPEVAASVVGGLVPARDVEAVDRWVGVG